VDLLVTDLTENMFDPIFDEIQRVVKTTAHVFLFVEFTELGNALGKLKQRGFQTKPKPYIWHIKGEEEYKCFLWCSPNMREPPSYVKEHNSHRRDKDSLHTLAKPYAFLEKLVTNSCIISGFVVDPICYGISLVKVCQDSGRSVRCYCPEKILHEQSILELKR